MYSAMQILERMWSRQPDVNVLFYIFCLIPMTSQAAFAYTQNISSKTLHQQQETHSYNLHQQKLCMFIFSCLASGCYVVSWWFKIWLVRHKPTVTFEVRLLFSDPLGQRRVERCCFGWMVLPPPGTLNNHFSMDVWWNNHFLCTVMIWNHPVETTIKKLVVWSSRQRFIGFHQETYSRDGSMTF